MTELSHIFYLDNENHSIRSVLPISDSDDTRLVIVMGPNDVRIQADLAAALHSRGSRVEFHRSPYDGKNALDFVLSFVAGMNVSRYPNAKHHIVSADKGYESLRRYAWQQKLPLDCIRNPVAPGVLAKYLGMQVKKGMAAPDPSGEYVFFLDLNDKLHIQSDLLSRTQTMQEKVQYLLLDALDSPGTKVSELICEQMRANADVHPHMKRFVVVSRNECASDAHQTASELGVYLECVNSMTALVSFCSRFESNQALETESTYGT